jgi:hypothetical protein
LLLFSNIEGNYEICKLSNVTEGKLPIIIREYNCFISSPNDVAEERKIAGKVISRINIIIRDALRIGLNPKKWENLPALIPALKDEKIQDILNKEVENSHFFILILHKRYGTKKKGFRISNTERELNTIIKAHEKDSKRKILAYFRNFAVKGNDPEATEVMRFRDRLASMNILYKIYNTPKEFEFELVNDLYDTIIKMHTSSEKSEILRRFWQLGSVTYPNIPQMAIVYPPISRKVSDPQHTADYWKKNLVPVLSFEDHKAIEKIRKAFFIMGFNRFNVYNSTDLPTELPHMNRVWICMPRCPTALKYFQKYKDVSRFVFVPKKGKQLARIIWKTKDGERLDIYSPLHKYFKFQRKKMDTTKEWTSHLGKIIAKDYAVLARFKSKRGSTKADGSDVWDYCVAGIHGLGTWGAGWFIDRKYEFFSKYSEDNDIQLLLEVTYRDNKIDDVKDVSEETKAYFSNQLTTKTINKEIATYLEKDDLNI